MQKARPIAGSQEESGSGKVMWIHALALTGTRRSPTPTACICRPRRTNRPNSADDRASRDLPHTFDEQPPRRRQIVCHALSLQRVLLIPAPYSVHFLRISPCRKERKSWPLAAARSV